MLSRYIGTALIGASMLASAVSAQDVDFSGETIEMIIPYGPGGGSSTHGRIVAEMLEKELPGNPAVVIKNIEGGGSVRGINQFAQRAQPDGLTVAGIATGTYFSYMLREPTVQYSLPDFIPILSSAYGIVAYGRSDFGLTGDGAHDIPHLQENTPVYLGDGPGDADMPALYCLDLLGIDIKGVWGVSRGTARQAFERGEAQLSYDNLARWESTLKPMRDEGKMVTIFTMGYQKDDGSVARDPTLPDTATCLELYEMVHGQELAGEERLVYDALFAIRMTASKTIVLPAGTPDNIVQTYRAAIERAVARPEYNTPEVRLQMGGYDQSIGEASVRAHTQASVMSPEAMASLETWLSEKWDVQLPD